MAGIEEVLERLVTDPAFRARLAADPTEALAGYTLAAEDLDLLATALSTDAGGARTMESRTSKTALAGMVLDSLTAGLNAADDGAGHDVDYDVPDAAASGGGLGLDQHSAEPNQIDSALLSSVEQWCGSAGAGSPADAAELGEALGIGSEQLARRVFDALGGTDETWTSDDVLRAVRRLVLGSAYDKLTFAFRLHDLDNDG